MSSFNFIESFFLLSLGITFVLIVLLVYHFKQRLSSMEQKCDTMFDIVQNLVKELNTVKGSLMQEPRMDVYRSHSKEEDTLKNHGLTEDNMKGRDDEYDEDDDEDDEEEDEEEEDEEEDEEDEEDEDKDEDKDDIKVINISDNIKLDDISQDIDIDPDTNSDTDVIELNDVNVSPIQINKLSTSEVDYKKKTVAELRSIITARNLASNPSKLSKTELLKLVEK